MSRGGAKRVKRCPVCVFTSANLPPGDLRGLSCWNCGQPLSDHPKEHDPAVPPGKAFAQDGNRTAWAYRVPR